MKSVMFVVGSMWIGGIQRVNAVVANELGNEYRVCLYSSMSTKESIYPLNIEHFKVDKDNPWTVKCNVLRATGLLGLKFVPQHIYKQDSERIISVISKWKPDTVVLSAENILYLPNLKVAFPNIKFIAWIHSNANIYLKRVFIGVQNDFIKGLNLADEVICLTHEDKVIYGKYNSNTKIIYNPLTIQHTGVSRLEEKMISWTGNLRNPVKGLDYLAEIASRLPDGWKISVAGGGNTKLFSKLIKKFGAESKIIYRGALTGEELKQHYLNSSIYLMTSRWEGFGLVLGEAMSFGLPIVSFSQSGSREILKDGKYGVLVENGDVASMVEELNKLIANLELRRFYQEKSLDRVRQFELSGIIKQWEQII